MKTDKNMADNILSRVSEIQSERAQRNRTIKKIAGVTCVFVMIFALSLGFFGNTDDRLSEPSVDTVTEIDTASNKGFFLMVANAANENVSTYSKEKNVSIPLGGILLIKDTKGLNGEAINRMSHELKLRLEELYGLDEGFHIRGSEGEVAVYFGTADELRFKVEHPSAIDYITFSCSDNGELTVYDESRLFELYKTVKKGAEITVTADEYANYDNGEGMHLRWFLSEDYIAELTEKNKLSDISDTIMGKVKYVDGTEELFTITLNFDDEGKLATTYNCNMAYYPIAE